MGAMADAERTSSQGFFEMLWDCEHCDTKGLLGKSQRHCPECGAPQNPDKRYFPKEGEARRVEGHKYEGADRQCPSCQKPMSSQGKNCTHCGAPLDGSQEVRRIVQAAPARKPFPKWLAYVLIGVLVLIGLLTWRACRTKDATLKVTGHRWERAVAVERFVEETAEAFEEDVPSDAMRTSCRTAPHPSKTVVDPTNCKDRNVDKGDGTFEVIRECAEKPADGRLCSYVVQRWRTADPVRTSGRGMTPIDPAETDLPPAEAPSAINAMRRRDRTATYILELGDQTCEVSEAVWRKYADGAELKLKVRAQSGKVVCGSIE